MADRLQKIIASHLGISRRKAEELISAGKVSVNGEKARLGDSASGEDEITVEGKTLGKTPKPVYIALNKPRGYVTSMSDESGRPDISDLLKDLPRGVFPCGRLDMYTEGLLICTNDGRVSNRLSHPSHEVWKEYLLKVSGGEDPCSELMRPMSLDGRELAPVKCRLLARESGVSVLSVMIREGRNRQIRRMCENCGLTVRSLKRVAEGEIKLGSLKSGRWRYLTKNEIDYLKNI